jgi:hypothetical protein
MTEPCITCGILIDTLGLEMGKCHGCRAEHARLKALVRTPRTPRYKELHPHRRAGPPRNNEKIRSALAVFFQNKATEIAAARAFAEKSVEENLPDYENIPL